MGEKSAAFVKGGIGCIALFLAIGMGFVLLGGSMHIDCGGTAMLFAIGGVLGLIVFAIYKKGYRKGQEEVGGDDFAGPGDDGGREAGE